MHLLGLQYAAVRGLLIRLAMGVVAGLGGWRLSMNLGNLRGVRFMYNARFKYVSLLAVFLFGLAATAIAQGKSANLYQMVMAHKDKVAWRPATNPPLPPEVCSFFSTCTEAGPVKFFTLPPATIDGSPLRYVAGVNRR